MSATPQTKRAPAHPCPECSRLGRRIDKKPGGYRRYQCDSGHRWSCGQRGKTPQRNYVRRFSFNALLAVMR